MVLFDQRKGQYWHLNSTGAMALQLLQAGYSAQQAAAALAEKLPDAADSVPGDVAALVGALQEARLMVMS